jgi:hypothetical protein
MTIEYDDNGKYFTNIVTKVPVPVMIQTVTHRIHGNIHITRDQRLIDELDLPEGFLAITDATVYMPDDRILYQSSFLAVQRCEIIWVLPDNEISGPTTGREK